MIEVDKIYNMDCIEGLALMGDDSVQMVLTDIPYGEVNRAKESGLRKLKKGAADDETFPLGALLPELYRVCSGSFYIFCGTEQVSEIRRFFRNKDMMTRLCVYKKSNPSPMNCQFNYLSDIECCVWAKKKGATFNGKYLSCVWEHPAGSSKIHPTQKPLSLFQRCVEVSSNEGDVILDTCMGSGTTAVASHRLNRHFIGFELNKEYYDIAKRRIAVEMSQTKLF